jgi:hypothetical protein
MGLATLRGVLAALGASFSRISRRRVVVALGSTDSSTRPITHRVPTSLDCLRFPCLTAAFFPDAARSVMPRWLASRPSLLRGIRFHAV